MLAGTAAVQPVPAPNVAHGFPRLTGRVVDNADLLGAADERALTAASARLERSSGHQFVIVTVRTLGGRPIDAYGMALGNAWGVGRRGVDDGVLLIVAPTERKVRIEVGRGLVRVLTDAEAAAIIDRAILPAFRRGAMAAGIRRGAARIIAELAPVTRKAA